MNFKRNKDTGNYEYENWTIRKDNVCNTYYIKKDNHNIYYKDATPIHCPTLRKAKELAERIINNELSIAIFNSVEEAISQTR